MLAINDPKIIEQKKNLDDFINGKITEKQFEINNALSMLNDISSMKFSLYPSTTINNYDKQYIKIFARNNSNYTWLHWMKKILDEDFYSQIDPYIEAYQEKDDNIRFYKGV